MICPEQLAADFEAEAYLGGKEVTIHLNDFVGQWILLIFYASDFTFV